MSDPFPVKKREEPLRERIEQMRREDEWHLFQDVCPACFRTKCYDDSRLTNARTPSNAGSRATVPSSPVRTRAMRATAALILCVLVMLVSCWGRPPGTYINVAGLSVSPDGNHIALTLKEHIQDGACVRSTLVLLDVSTGSITELLRWEPGEAFGKRTKGPAPYADAWFRAEWSPDSDAIYTTVTDFRKGHSIWGFSAPHGKPKRLRQFGLGPPWCSTLRVSPDGKWLLFMDDVTKDLFRVAADGSDLTQLTSSGDVFPAGGRWAPDGRHIYYCRGFMLEPDRRGIWKMSSDGTDKQAVLEGYSGASLEVSPSGAYLAFVVPPPYNPSRLFVHSFGHEKPTLVVQADKRINFQWHPRLDILSYQHGGCLYEWQAGTGLSRKLGLGYSSLPIAAPGGNAVFLLKDVGRSRVLFKQDVISGKTEQLYPKPHAGTERAR